MLSSSLEAKREQSTSTTLSTWTCSKRRLCPWANDAMQLRAKQAFLQQPESPECNMSISESICKETFYWSISYQRCLSSAQPGHPKAAIRLQRYQRCTFSKNWLHWYTTGHVRNVNVAFCNFFFIIMVNIKYNVSSTALLFSLLQVKLLHVNSCCTGQAIKHFRKPLRSL